MTSDYRFLLAEHVDPRQFINPNYGRPAFKNTQITAYNEEAKRIL